MVKKQRDMNDGQLLEQFVKENSEGAFCTVMQRHLGLVFGIARRITGNPGLSEEVTQTVFLLLAKKARTLSRNVSLTGWLYRTTRFVAARALRAELRRSRREQEAATMSVLNEAEKQWHQITPK